MLVPWAMLWRFVAHESSSVVVTDIMMMCTPRTDGSAAGAAMERSRGAVLTSPLRVPGRRPDSAARALSMVVGSAHQIKRAFLFEHPRCRIRAAGSALQVHLWCRLIYYLISE